jgi:hypothetical protein
MTTSISPHSFTQLPSQYGQASNSGPSQPATQASADSTRFGACDPCSCPCSCLSGLVTAGALALGGLGLIKLGPKVINQLKSRLSPALMDNMALTVKKLISQTKTASQQISPSLPNP